MKLFIWEYHAPVSHDYHDGGGLAIVAESVAQAQAHWDEYVAEQGGFEYESPLGDPDQEYPLDTDMGPHPPHIHVFPDAGCC